MSPEAKSKRKAEILDAALTELTARGWSKTSMSGIAKRAHASKETLYAWFGDRKGLFRELVRYNARSVDAIELSSEAENIEQSLTEFGAALLHIMLSESSIALSRAAIADVITDPHLGQLIAEEESGACIPPLMRFLERGVERGVLEIADVDQAARDYLGLLKADAQLASLIDPGEVQIFDILRQAEHAARQWLRLYKSA